MDVNDRFTWLLHLSSFAFLRCWAWFTGKMDIVHALLQAFSLYDVDSISALIVNPFSILIRGHCERGEITLFAVRK
ncbi:hypothetical protein OE88DRAFT_1650434 [Heliocybe sulcata]|uniref:Uncharacterized protein n=1 Tax=Heliocybe sulcata TaxID=5364 RepID=A0A5C3NL87_9AGAM|nr:hypothetical protein OE88DRAFT_1650434 [Heliocybe sulcata]